MPDPQPPTEPRDERLGEVVHISDEIRAEAMQVIKKLSDEFFIAARLANLGLAFTACVRARGAIAEYEEAERRWIDAANDRHYPTTKETT